MGTLLRQERVYSLTLAHHKPEPDVSSDFLYMNERAALAVYHHISDQQPLLPSLS